MIKSRRRTDGKENCKTCLRLKREDKSGAYRCRIDRAYARYDEPIETMTCDKYVAQHAGRTQ